SPSTPRCSSRGSARSSRPVRASTKRHCIATLVARHSVGPSKPAVSPSQHLKSVMPLLQELIRPRRRLLAVGFALMIVNRLCGLVLPASTKFLVDDIVGKRHMQLLTPLILAVIGATLIQAITSFTLTQLLSKAAQRLIAELRRKVQEHVGRL